VSDMRHVVHIIDRRCDVKGVLATHAVWEKIPGNKR
jgi:hypothetical protein